MRWWKKGNRVKDESNIELSMPIAPTDVYGGSTLSDMSSTITSSTWSSFSDISSQMFTGGSWSPSVYWCPKHGEISEVYTTSIGHTCKACHDAWVTQAIGTVEQVNPDDPSEKFRKTVWEKRHDHDGRKK